MKAKLRSFLDKHFETMKEKFEGASVDEKQAMIKSMDEAKAGLSAAFSKGQEAVNSCLDGVEDEDAII